MNKFYGTENYIQNIIEKYSDMILRISYSYMKNFNDAEDITQETFIKLLEKQPTFQSSEQERAWLIKVAINLSKDKLKSSWFKKTAPLEGEFIATCQEDNEIIATVLSLPLKYRSVIFLFYYEDYSISEIANILNLKESTVGSQLSRGRKLLKSKLMEDFEDE
ncbi:RNA polymerase sigma-70 factor (ECF subfamily) [Clostridium pascui]|uniref:sigma-70 family RNA polymerase sigma factor n=1 Tax=Clostridium pascui TaxID=46609 RepID=UPI00195674C7|nr:sigma-70 family RNA polymerase sigma factor [Clostridium pascui]MBM7871715.1 RNA polymerase sigma-70 factor (ECF subfamily) [Clostridium pascui]